MKDDSTVEERNTDLFFEIADIIDFKPEQYAQETWGEFAPTQEDKEKFEAKFNRTPYGDDDSRWSEVDCGTKMCVAGWACSLNGYLPYVSQTWDGNGGMVHRFDWGTVNQRENLLERRPTEPVSMVAAGLLGITEREADCLFNGEVEWTSDDLRAFGKGEDIVWYGDPDDDDE